MMRMNAWSSSTEPLDHKVQRVFGDMVIDKRRLPSSQLQKRGVPAYVGEWVLSNIVPGSGPLTAAEAEKIQSWAQKNVAVPTDREIFKHRLARGEHIKLLTHVRVEIELRGGTPRRVAKITALDLNDVEISDGLLNTYPDLLRHGMWGVVELLYTSAGPVIVTFKPMQSVVNLDVFKQTRAQFTLDEWRDLIVVSMGYRWDVFTSEEKLILLMRLLPLVQKNMHLMELAPKGTGKSYLYENISPKVRLISGGNVSPAVLFVNNATGQWGLLGRFAVVVLDEVQTLRFEKPEEIVGGLKGFLANGRLTRGGLHETSSDCSLVLLANITLNAAQQPVREPLIEELPRFLRETAFLDRIRGIIPGWKLPKLSHDSFACSVGWKADVFGSVLLALREDLSADQYVARRVQLRGERAYKRNEDAIRAIASGLMKLLFPDGIVSDADFERYCLQPAIELRQYVWDQLYSLDAEYRQYDRRLECELLDG